MNEIVLLVKVDPWKDSVAVLGSVSVADDAVAPRLLNVPNRDRAAAIAQRSAAQNGQYSAPT